MVQTHFAGVGDGLHVWNVVVNILNNDRRLENGAVFRFWDWFGS
jgi:hypothetical protein